MGFKEDADFARYVSMGALATDVVRHDLASYGHEVIELERYAMANKVWQTKVKRLRLADLVCVRCGLRIESRGKSQLGIVVSHSDAVGRAWDDGMRDHDLYAFLRVDIDSEPPHTSRPLYFRTADLRATVGGAKQSIRKATSEGSELTLTWKSWVPARSGTYYGLDTRGRIVCHWDNGRSYRYGHWNSWESRHAYLDEGGTIKGDETMVAGTVAPPSDLTCGGGWAVARALYETDAAERYAAVKVAGILLRHDLARALLGIASHEADWRLHLETVASLARMEPQRWTTRVVEIALASSNAAEHRIESVFVLSEIPTDEAAEGLFKVAAPGDDKPSELRAAAVWGLARGVRPRPDLVLEYAIDDDDLVALHAIAGLPSLPDELISTLMKWLNGDNRRAAVAAQLLLRHQAVQPLLDAVRRGGRGRLWALRALGDLKPKDVRQGVGELLTPELEELLEPIWVGQDDWLRGSGADGLKALDVQKIRFNPLL